MRNRYQKEPSEERETFIGRPCTQTFVCKACGRTVVPEGAGSDHRNHCPTCLCSLHVDQKPGDRASDCGGIMEPIAVWVKDGGEWALVHRCRKCGKLDSNRIAADDHPVKLVSLALKPLASPPFPLEHLDRMMEMLYPGSSDRKENESRS